MLDNEPDTQQNTPAAEVTTPPARPRRRAASRPAGPPKVLPAPPEGGLEPAVSASPDPVSDPIADRLDALVSGSATDAATAVDAVPEQPTAEPEAAPPSKPTRRRTRKTAQVEPAEPEPASSVEPAAEQAPTEAPARTRRRTRKTAAVPAAETDADDLVAEAVQEESSLPATDQPTPVVTAPVDETADATDTDADADAVEGAAAAEEQDGAPAALEGDAEPTVEETAAPVDETPEPVEDADDADEAGDAEDSADESDEAGEGGRRRRRRRGGRRRRRTGDADSSDEADGPEAEQDGDEPSSVAGPAADVSLDEPRGAAVSTDAESDDDGSGDGEEGDGTRRRRRRRRRRGEDAGSAPDDPTEVVVRVREPRKSSRSEKSAEDQVTGISGSTRMEAKRQRRREGREAGRRRAPILSEAEFLARREAVTRKMIIRQRSDAHGSGDTLTQIAVLEDDILVEHYVDRESATSLIGNVYLGRVQNVLPSMEAAFIDIGRGRNAVLYAGEVDWDSFGAQGQNRKVEKVLKSGQTVLVQVTKDPVGAKGARLTNHVSIPGRYIVYAPAGHLSGISRKLPENERKRLKDILSGLVGEASVIVRTAAEGASEEELVRDVNRLKAQWSDIEAKVAKGQAPQLLYGEPDLTVRIVRDLFTEDFSELLVSGDEGPDDAYESIAGYVQHVAPHLADRLKRWEPSDGTDVFARHRIDEQIAKALERKVFLPSGGSLVIDRTEAMTVIDVNTGKFTGSGGNLEATVTSNNLEAAEEIVRQLRLRDVGGIIVIDFIDMVLPANRELLLRRLVECLGRDRTRHQVAEVTSLGLVQMTRKKIGTGLLEAFGTECPTCHGRGYEIHDEPVESQRQADGGAREQRGSRRGGGNGGGNNSGSGGNNGGGHDHGSNDSGSGSGNGSGGGSGRSGRSRGGRNRRSSDEGTHDDSTSGGTDPAIRAAVQHAIAEVAAGSRHGLDDADVVTAPVDDTAPDGLFSHAPVTSTQAPVEEPAVEQPADEAPGEAEPAVEQPSVEQPADESVEAVEDVEPVTDELVTVDQVVEQEDVPADAPGGAEKADEDATASEEAPAATS